MQYMKLDGTLTDQRGQVHIEDPIHGQRLVALYREINEQKAKQATQLEQSRVQGEAEADDLVSEFAALRASQNEAAMIRSLVAHKKAGYRPIGLRPGKVPAWPKFTADEDPKPTIADIREVFDSYKAKGEPLVGFGIVQGLPPHHQLVIDFDLKGVFHPVDETPITRAVLDATGVDLRQLLIQTRGDSGRYHVIINTTEPVKTQKLALKLVDGRPEVIAEVRGKGSQAVRAPSLHPSANVYHIVSGDPLDPPQLPVEQVEAVLAVIRTFDEMPVVERHVQPKPSTPASGHDDLIGRYNSENSIVSVLLGEGYEETGSEWMKHPAGDGQHSVHILEHSLAHHFSPRDKAHRVSDKTTNCGVLTTAFDWYLHDQHGGDLKRAIRALAEHYGVAHKRSEFPDDILTDWNGRWDVPAPAPEPEPVMQIVEPAKVTVPAPTDLEDVLVNVPVDLSPFPKAFRRMVKAFAKVNPFLPLDACVLPALFPASVIVGKRMISKNGSYEYFPNIWIALLLASGKGKSSLHILIESELKKLGRYGIGTFTMASLFRRGSVLNPKDFRTHQQNGTFEVWLKDEETQAQGRLNSHFILMEEATDKLKRALGAWDSKNPSADTGNLISLMDSRSNMMSETKGAGFEALFDNCWCGFSTAQDSEWVNVMDTDQFIARGLLTRFLHGGVGQEFIGFEADEEFDTAEAAQEYISGELGRMSGEAEGITSAIRCDVAVEGHDDYVKHVKESYQNSDVFKALLRFDENLAGYAITKLLSQAFKLAMLMAWFNRDHVKTGDGGDGWGVYTHKRIDISRYFEPCYDMLMRSFLGYSKHKTVVTEFGQQEQKLAQLYRRRGEPITARDAMRSVRSFKRVNEAMQVFELLVRAGLWEVAPEPEDKKGRKTNKFRPVAVTN